MADLAVMPREQALPDAPVSRAQDALDARLERVTVPAGGFTAAARTDAMARLRSMGLPGPRDEYWRYTDPRPFNAPVAPAQPRGEESPDRPLFDGIDRLRIVFVDGVFDPEASDDLTMEGVEIATLGRADAGDHWARDLYGVLEAAGQSPVPRPFAVLNTAAAADGVLIRVTGKPSRPVHVIHRRALETADVVWHHVLRVEQDAHLTFLETGTVGARANGVMEVDLRPGGRLDCISAKRSGSEWLALSHLFVRVAERAQFKGFALSLNGTLMRHESVIHIAGNDASAHVAGAVLGDGRSGRFHHDDTVFVTHAAERCESRQVFKKVLKNGATGVFQGKILVRPGAQKTDGYQISQALLLDEQSQFLAKPELEIYADDVKCSHGSTTGAIDDEALFYLRSRGVPRDRAVVFLVLSFLADALAEVADDTLRDRIGDRLEAWLVRHSE